MIGSPPRHGKFLANWVRFWTFVRNPKFILALVMGYLIVLLLGAWYLWPQKDPQIMRLENDWRTTIQSIAQFKSKSNWTAARFKVDDFLKRWSDESLPPSKKATFRGVYREYTDIELQAGNTSGAYFWINRAIEMKGPRKTRSEMYNILSNLCKKLDKADEATEAAFTAFKLNKRETSLKNFLKSMWWSQNYSQFDPMFSQLKEWTFSAIAKNKKPALGTWESLHFPFSAKEIGKINAAASENHIGMNKDFVSRTFGTDPKFPLKKRNHRLRIGFVSGDFRGHALGLQIKHMFQFFNKSEFEIYAYDVYPQKEARSPTDATMLEISRNVEHFVNAREATPSSLAQEVQKSQIDILVDLSLWTAHNKLGTFVKRPAPINVAYLGMGSGSGSWNDYLLTDRVVVPQKFRGAYLEKMAYFPFCYHIADHEFTHRLAWRYPPSEEASPVKAEISEKKTFWFCNYAGLQKIDPQALNIWLNIMERTFNTSLILKDFNPDHKRRFWKMAEDRGISKDRIIYHPAYASEHVTHWHNGHSGSLDMGWAGVPILTYPSEYIAGRVAASLMTAIGVQGTIVNSWASYENLAVELSKDPPKLEAIRRKMEQGRKDGHMFGVERMVRIMEDGFRKMWARYEKGQKPEDLQMVDPLEPNALATWPPPHWISE